MILFYLQVQLVQTTQITSTKQVPSFYKVTAAFIGVSLSLSINYFDLVHAFHSFLVCEGSENRNEV